MSVYGKCAFRVGEWAQRVLMVAQDLYVRTVYRRLWRDAGL